MSSDGDGGCLGFIVLVGIIWVIFNLGSGQRDLSSADSLQYFPENCVTSSINLFQFSSSLSPLDREASLESFFNDTNPFPFTPEVAIERALFGIQERQPSLYFSSFEESAQMNTGIGISGNPGYFVNVTLTPIFQDEHTAQVQFEGIWIPADSNSPNGRRIGLHFCEPLLLVYARKNIGVNVSTDNSSSVNLGINLSGWFLAESQIGLLPYNFSELLDHVLDEEREDEMEAIRLENAFSTPLPKPTRDDRVD